MRSNLGVEILEYIEEMYCFRRACERSRPEGEACIVCDEKKRVMDRLKNMLLRHYQGTPYHENIASMWPSVPAEDRQSNHDSVQRAVAEE